MIHPVGGSPSLPTSVALRGPDPTETLINVDGHSVNNGNAGDFDLSLLDPADYSNIQLIYGISPSALIGPNTIDGAINIRTLDPTINQHGLLRLSTGSFGAFGATLETSGTASRLGYALSLHRTTSQGEVNQDVTDVDTGDQQFVGSAVTGSTALGKIRYTLGHGDSYIGLTFHDQSIYRDLSAGLTSIPQPDDSSSSASSDALLRRPSDAPIEADSFAGSSLQAHNAAYGIDYQTPLGPADSSGIAHTTMLARYQEYLAAQSVFGPGANTSPYLYNDRDLIGDGILQIDHQMPKGSLTLQYDWRHENLTTNFVAGVENDESVARKPLDSSGPEPAPTPGVQVLNLGQVQQSIVLRYVASPTAQVHYTVAAYYSDFSTFGTSFDPRLGFVYTPDANTSFRATVGTTFQAPQLPELVVPPVLPPPVGGVISIGNPNLKADYATDYDLGFEHYFGQGNGATHLSVDLYQSNLRQPAATLVPPPSDNPECGSSSSSDARLRRPRDSSSSQPECPLSFPVNAGDAVYNGFELRLETQLAQYTTLHVGYSVNSAYLTAVPPDIQDGSLVIGEQALGLPLQKGIFSIDRSPPSGLEYSAGLVYQGAYNGYNQPKFAVLNAMLGYRLRGWELSLAGTNLTNVYNNKFTYQEAGVPYGGLDGPITTDAFALQGTAFTVTLTRRF